MRNFTAWYSLILCQPAFQENKIYNFKIHLFSSLNTKQTSDGIFSNKTGEIFPVTRQSDFKTKVSICMYIFNCYISI